jgi:hypothetical protein
MAEQAQTSVTNPQIFISYSRKDLPFVQQLRAALKVCGFDVSIDLSDITGGEEWEKRLSALIGNADTVVFVLSAFSAASKACDWEVNETLSRGKRLLPVVPRALGHAVVPESLRKLNYIYFNEDATAEPDLGGGLTSPVTGLKGIFSHKNKAAEFRFGEGLAALVTALRTDLEVSREHTRYGQRAGDWLASGRSPDRLLSGHDIELAKQWLSRPRMGPPEPTGLQREFIKTSEEVQRAKDSEELRKAEEHRKAIEQERDNAKQNELRATKLRDIAERQALGVSGMIASACEQGATLFLALKQEFAATGAAKIRTLADQLRHIMDAALDAAENAAEIKIQNQQLDSEENFAKFTKKALAKFGNEELSDLQKALVIHEAMSSEMEKQAMERQKITEELSKFAQLPISELPAGVKLRKPQDAFLAVDEYIRDFEEAKAGLVKRLLRLGDHLRSGRDDGAAGKAYRAALAFLEEADEQALQVQEPGAGTGAEPRQISMRESIERRLSALVQKTAS